MSRRFKIFALAMAIALTSALIPVAIMAFGGETQVLGVGYDVNNDGTPESIETWSVLASDNGNGTYDNTTTYLSWTDMTGTDPSLGNVGPYRLAGANAAELIASIITRDQTDQRTLQSISTQGVYGNSAQNTATILNTYTPVVGNVMLPLATGNSWIVSSAASTSLLPAMFDWVDTFNVVVGGIVTIDAAGQPLSVPCYEVVWTWTTSTMQPIIGTPPALPFAGCMIEYWAATGQSIEPLVQIDAQHFAGTEYRTTVGGSPTPPFPEVATVVLLSMGLIALGGVVLFKRRRASLTAA